MNLHQYCFYILISTFLIGPLVYSDTKKQPRRCVSFYLKNTSKRPPPIKFREKTDDSLVTFLKEDDFSRLAKFNSDQTYPFFLKFAVRVEENGKLGTVYFFDTNKYPFHSQFLIEHFFPQADISEIDKKTLYPNGRKFLLGTVLLKNNDISSNQTQEYHVDWINDGVLPASKVIEAMKHILVSSKGMENLRLIVPRKATEEYSKQVDLFRSAKIDLKFSNIGTSKIEVYSANWSVGRLKILSSEDFANALAQKTIQRSDILILSQAPREIPQVSGIVVSEPTTPSSHIALLSQMYQIPFAYDKEAISKYSHLNGQLVYTTTEKLPDGVVQKINIQMIKDSDALALRKLKVPPSLRPPAIDQIEDRIVPVNSLTARSVSAYGAKSAGLGLIKRILPHNAPDPALGLPIYYYKQFLEQAKVATTSTSIASFIQDRLAQLETASSLEASTILKSIRDTIMSASIPEPILAKIIQTLKQNFPDTERLKFRSSSNIEDLKGFNGAGLYDSKGGKISDPESIAKAIKTVWSSIFNERAYLARKQFGIVETSVGMAILIQKSFKEELANGVAILKLDSNKDFISEITGFPGEDLEVTAAPLGVIPETMMVQKGYSQDEPYQLEIRTKSTEVPEGRTLLYDSEYRQLTTFMQAIMKAWPKTQNPEDGLDFEWKVVIENGQRKVYIKQARPVPERIGFHESKMTVLGGSYKMDLTQPESPEGLLVYQLPKRLHLEFNTISITDLKTQGTSLLKSIKSESNAGIIELKVNSIQHRLEDNDINSTQKGRKLVIQLNAQHPILGEMIVNSEFTFSVDSSGKTTLPILNPALHRYSIDFNSTKWPQKFDGNSNRFQADYSALTEPVINSKPETQKLTSSDGAFEFTFTEENLLVNDGIYQKTKFKNIFNLTVGTKDNGSFSIDSKGLLYAPSHHNFTWSYVIDLNYVVGSTAQIEKIKKQYGRFIVITKLSDSRTVTTFYSDIIGEKTKALKEIDMK